jgi:hypothetical protein
MILEAFEGRFGERPEKFFSFITYNTRKITQLSIAQLEGQAS